MISVPESAVAMKENVWLCCWSRFKGKVRIFRVLQIMGGLASGTLFWVLICLNDGLSYFARKIEVVRALDGNVLPEKIWLKVVLTYWSYCLSIHIHIYMYVCVYIGVSESDVMVS